MSKFETIFRPLIPVDVSLLTRPRRKEKAAVDEIPRLIIVGRGANDNSGNTTRSQTLTSIYANKNQNEVKRVYDVVRVKNPEDTSQYVDTEVVRKLTINKEAGTKKEVNYGFDDTVGANTERLQSNLTRTRSA